MRSLDSDHNTTMGVVIAKVNGLKKYEQHEFQEKLSILPKAGNVTWPENYFGHITLVIAGPRGTSISPLLWL